MKYSIYNGLTIFLCLAILAFPVILSKKSMDFMGQRLQHKLILLQLVCINYFDLSSNKLKSIYSNYLFNKEMWTFLEYRNKVFTLNHLVRIPITCEREKFLKNFLIYFYMRFFMYMVNIFWL